MLTIYEPPVRNSGIMGGKFLERTRVAKPTSTPDSPVYYGPQDFFIGATIEIFGHRFIITSADAFVLSYMEEHSNQFPRECCLYIGVQFLCFWWDKPGIFFLSQ
jgi:hypothetical protein